MKRSVMRNLKLKTTKFITGMNLPGCKLNGHKDMYKGHSFPKRVKAFAAEYGKRVMTKKY
jgi:hypothetical protein